MITPYEEMCKNTPHFMIHCNMCSCFWWTKGTRNREMILILWNSCRRNL